MDPPILTKKRKIVKNTNIQYKIDLASFEASKSAVIFGVKILISIKKTLNIQEIKIEYNVQFNFFINFTFKIFYNFCTVCYSCLLSPFLFLL